jgi:hypothetical protein
LNLGASLTKTSSVTAQGNARIVLAPGGNKVIKTGALAITGTAKLDLSDNRLITTTAVGTADSAGNYSGVSGMIQRAYLFGDWSGPGLTSSAAAASMGLTTLAVGDAGDVLFLGETETATWAGQTVSGASTIAMYTYAGDLNFDGLVDAADYGIIDNYSQFHGTTGYVNGDFNYDGIIDAGDYGIIDNTYQLQGSPLPSGAAMGSAGVTAVPEPSACMVASVAAAMLLRRRRRRRHSLG